MANPKAGGGRDGQKRKLVICGGSGSGDDGDDDEDDDDKDNHIIQKKVPRLDIPLKTSAALILLERWGSPINSGISATLYELIDQLKSCGLIIHCTVLEADGKTVREARRLGVNLILPDRKPLLQKYVPTFIWLTEHEIFFPRLKLLTNVKFIFGFAVVSSATALDLKEKGHSDAKLCHINVWNPEELTPEMFPYDRDFFEENCNQVDVLNHRADVVLSIGPKVFDHFTYRHGNRTIKHLQLIPLPDKVYFDIPSPMALPDSRNFQILTPFEHCAIPELNKRGVVPKAMNLVANNFDNFGEPPKWQILCTLKKDDKDVAMENLDPHPKLRRIIKGLIKDGFFNELQCSHLVILPPSSIHSLSVVLATIASGRPILVPYMSEGEYFIQKYFPDYRHDVVVEMRDGPEALKKQIMNIVQHYPVHLKKAAQMKEMMNTIVMEDLIKVNSQLMEEVTRPTQQSRSPQAVFGRQSIDTSAEESASQESIDHPPSTSPGSFSTSQPASGRERAFGTVSMQIEASHGNAIAGSSMDKVETVFYEHEGSRPTTEGTGRTMNALHNDLKVENIGKGCLRYVMKCGSLEALEALWSEYISGRLDKTIHSTIITPALLSKIQAHYLTLDIYIPVQEYLLCKREIPLVTGSVPTPSRRRSVAAITELKAAPREDITRHHTVDSLNLLLSQMQIRDNQTISELLSRDDFSVEELQGHKSTFVTKRWKVRSDVCYKDAEFGKSQNTKEELIMTLKAEFSSSKELEDEFIRLKIHAGEYSANRKAVLHEAGQKLMMQRESVTNQATLVKQKFEAGKAEFEKIQSDEEQANQGSAPTPSRRHSVAAITELKSAPRENIPRNRTVDSLNLHLSQMQIRDKQTISELLSRDDFSVEELQGHRFGTKQIEVKPDVCFKEAKFGNSQSTKEELRRTLNAGASSTYKVEDEFVQLKIHASKFSADSKAVLHEAGQKPMMQREEITNQATPVKEKSEAGKTLCDQLLRDVERINQGYPVKESVLEVFGKGSMPGQLNWALGIYIKNNGQWVICDRLNHRVQVIDPIKVCCDLILQFHAFPNPFNPVDVTVDEDNDKYFMSDYGNGQVVVSSGQSKILNCFGRKEGIDPRGTCLSPDGSIFIGDYNGYVRKYNKSGEHMARTEKGQVILPYGLIVNKKCIFVSDKGRQCVHVLNHQMQSIRDIGKGHLKGPMGLCFDHQQDGIYVCDDNGNRVVHFNCDGEFLSYKGQGQLDNPHYIALCKDNPYILVVTQGHCIKLLYI